MSFLAPIATGIAALFGIHSQNQQEKTQQQGLQDQNAIAHQELGDRQKTYDESNSFYTPYTKSGSPFLAQQQSENAAQNAQAGNAAAGTFRSEMGSSGVGFGPNGATAAGLSNMASQNSATEQGNYLQNLLQNEQVKFQAQRGLLDAGQMMSGQQNQPNVRADLQPASTTGAIGAAGNALGGLFGGQNLGPAINNVGSSRLGIPAPGTLQTTNMQTPSVLTPPGTQGSSGDN